jgi:hypothetical protein
MKSRSAPKSKDQIRFDPLKNQKEQISKQKSVENVDLSDIEDEVDEEGDASVSLMMYQIEFSYVRLLFNMGLIRLMKTLCIQKKIIQGKIHGLTRPRKMSS